MHYIGAKSDSEIKIKLFYNDEKGEFDMITKRQLAIINLLIQQNDWMKATQIAKALSISIRTLKTEIQHINQYQHHCIISSKKGYYLQKNMLSLEYQEVSHIPENYEERKDYILKQLILNESVLFDQICEELYISNVTLQNKLNKIRKDINQHQLNIHIKKIKFI